MFIRKFEESDYPFVKEIYQQGKGVGQKLLAELILESENNLIWMLQAAIFPENIASIKLHKNNGFCQLGLREKLGKMNGVWRDVVLMERRSKVVGISDKTALK